jgi:hypothetical protein
MHIRKRAPCVTGLQATVPVSTSETGQAIATAPLSRGRGGMCVAWVSPTCHCPLVDPASVMHRSADGCSGHRVYLPFACMRFNALEGRYSNSATAYWSGALQSVLLTRSIFESKFESRRSISAMNELGGARRPLPGRDANTRRCSCS